MRSVQYEEELSQLLCLMRSVQCKTALEIGCGECGTAIYLATEMGEGALVVSVDLPAESGGTDPINEQNARALLGSDKFKLIRGNSASTETLNAVKDALGGREVDFLLIDAEHTEAAALTDYNVYRSLVRKNGIIAFHDITMPALWPMWNRLRGMQPPPTSAEFIKDVHQIGCGLGVLMAR